MEWDARSIAWVVLFLTGPIAIVLVVALIRGYNVRIKVWREHGQGGTVTGLLKRRKRDDGDNPPP